MDELDKNDNRGMDSTNANNTTHTKRVLYQREYRGRSHFVGEEDKPSFDRSAVVSDPSLCDLLSFKMQDSLDINISRSTDSGEDTKPKHKQINLQEIQSDVDKGQDDDRQSDFSSIVQNNDDQIVQSTSVKQRALQYHGNTTKTESKSYDSGIITMETNIQRNTSDPECRAENSSVNKEVKLENLPTPKSDEVCMRGTNQMNDLDKVSIENNVFDTQQTTNKSGGFMNQLSCISDDENTDIHLASNVPTLDIGSMIEDCNAHGNSLEGTQCHQTSPKVLDETDFTQDH